MAVCGADDRCRKLVFDILGSSFSLCSVAPNFFNGTGYPQILVTYIFVTIIVVKETNRLVCLGCGKVLASDTKQDRQHEYIEKVPRRQVL